MQTHNLQIYRRNYFFFTYRQHKRTENNTTHFLVLSWMCGKGSRWVGGDCILVQLKLPLDT